MDFRIKVCLKTESFGNYWMTGTIDEVVVYSRALSEKELNELMEDGMSVALDIQPGGKLVTTWSRIKTR